MSAIRIMDTMTIAPMSNFAHFFVLTFFHAGVADPLSNHIAKVQMWGPTSEANSGKWGVVAHAPEFPFTLSGKTPGIPPGFCLTTEFNVDLGKLGNLGTYLVQVFLDNILVAQAPLTLRR